MAGFGMFVMSGWVFFICTGAAGFGGKSGNTEIRAVSFFGPGLNGAGTGVGAATGRGAGAGARVGPAEGERGGGGTNGGGVTALAGAGGKGDLAEGGRGA